MFSEVSLTGRDKVDLVKIFGFEDMKLIRKPVVSKFQEYMYVCTYTGEFLCLCVGVY